MELNKFIEKYTDWLRANGVTADPKITKSDGYPAPGYVPPTFIELTNSNGSVLRQAATILHIFPDPGRGLNEARQFFGLARMEDLYDVWQDYLNPPPPPPAPPTIGVGPRIPQEIVDAFAPSGRIVKAREYYQMGGLDVPEWQTHKSPDGKQYLAVKPSPFTTWLMLL